MKLGPGVLFEEAGGKCIKSSVAYKLEFDFKMTNMRAAIAYRKTTLNLFLPAVFVFANFSLAP